MRYNDHGGDCCGITHVMDFPRTATPNAIAELKQLVETNELTESQEENILEDHVEYDEDGEFVRQVTPWKGRFGHLIEISLVDAQMVSWAPHLKALGFKLCDRFKNDNSGNIVNLLTYKTKKAVPKKPYKW